MIRRLIRIAVIALAASPANAETIVGAPPSSDTTALLQTIINSVNGTGEIVLPCGTWNTGTGFSAPSGGLIVRGEAPGCAVIHLTANVAAFSCGNPAQPSVVYSAPFSVRDLIITGTAPNFNGTVNISDSGQGGVHVFNCRDASVKNVVASNLSGTAFDCEYPASDFKVQSAIKISGTVHDSYRGYHAHNSCEYAIFSDLVGRNNVFGAVVAAGNVIFDNFQLVYNYTNIQILGAFPISNPCHGIFTSGNSNHAVAYNLDILSCPLGQRFSNVDMVGDGGGSLSAGGGNIRISNSRGINIMGGVIGSNIVVNRADPVNGSTVTAGANKLEGSFVRDDISGFALPVVDYAGGLEMKLNFNSAGQWSSNN